MSPMAIEPTSASAVRAVTVGLAARVAVTVVSVGVLAGCGAHTGSGPTVTVTVPPTGTGAATGSGSGGGGASGTPTVPGTVAPPAAPQAPAPIPEHGGDIAYVITASGITRCNLYPQRVECQSGEFMKTFTTTDGQAANGFTYQNGTVEWVMGNMGLGGEGASNPTRLRYGRTYTAFGWTVNPTVEQTVFSRGGHGVRVSITSVTTF
jgi:hypothetical protein